MIELITRHMNAVSAVKAFSSMYPDGGEEDDLHALVVLLGDNLQESFDAIYPFICRAGLCSNDENLADNFTGKTG